MVFWLSVLYIVLAVLHISDWTIRHIIIPYFLRKRSLHWLDTPEKKHAYDLFHTLYENVRAKPVAQRAVRQLKLDKNAFTYGEIDFISYARLLETVMPMPGEQFVDLGSGSGKAVLATGLLYPHCQLLGIELIPALYELSLCQLEKFKSVLLHGNTPTRQQQNIHFINQDMLQTDFSQANIVFINATCYSQEFMDQLSLRLQKLAEGSRIVITTKTLPAEHFYCLDNRTLLMSSGKCHCRVYLKQAHQVFPEKTN